MKRAFRWLSKDGEFSGLELEHVLTLITGVCVLAFTVEGYHNINPVVQVIILITYLGFLVGLAPIPLPTFRKNFWVVYSASLLSGLLDSFIVLDRSKEMKTVEEGQSAEEVARLKEGQPTEGVRARFLALLMIGALIGGLVLWFGEVYAAGLYLNDGRTGVLSALYIVPPVLVFLAILGWHAQRLPISVIKAEGQKLTKRDLAEFAAGIALLLLTHNPLLCLGILLIYAVITNQGDQLLTTFRHHTEINVMLVLVIAASAGTWLLTDVIEPLGLDKGEYLPIIPAAVQAVLWGPLYADPTVHFWTRIATLSTGALILPISSLVGVMLFKKLSSWKVYMKYGIAYAVVWYAIMRAWIWLTIDTPIGHFLEQWAHTGGAH